MFDSGQVAGAGSGGGRTPGRVLADRIVARDARIRAEELGTIDDLKSWLDLHSVDPTDPFATGVAGGAGRQSGSDGTPCVDEFAVREYAALRHLSEPTARALMIDVADLEHRFPKLWAAVHALWLPVWQARKIVAACRELSQEAAALVDSELVSVVAGLPWSRILTRLAAAIMTADPALAEARRQQAKQARFVQLCRSEDGINTMIVRADHGDLIMVYALVDRLADILALEGSTEPADERRATAFGLLAQPAVILAMLLRHTGDGGPSTDQTTETGHATAMAAEGDLAVLDRSEPPPPDLRAEPPVWTAEDHDEPDDPAPVDHPNVPDHWQQRLRPRPAPEPPAPGWDREPDDPDHLDLPDESGLRMDVPGLASLLTQRGTSGCPPPGRAQRAPHRPDPGHRHRGRPHRPP